VKAIDPDGILKETPAQKWRRRIIKTIMRAGLALVVCAALVLLARLLHRRVLYQPPGGEPPALPEGAVAMTARAADGAPVYALDFAPEPETEAAAKPRGRPTPRSAPRSTPRPAPAPKRTIVHFHGNTETVEDNAALARELAKKGFEVVLVEYRGYGHAKTPGFAPTEQGIYEDAEAVLDALAARGTGPDRVALWGQALGAGVAAEMALRGKGSRLELVAPFTSTIDLAARVVPFVPLTWIMVDRFDTLAKAPRITTPALVVHGEIDDVIPVEEGEAIAKALPNATFMKIAEGRHDNLYKSAATVTALAAHAGG
jgi:alpha-beta hydrolase superfamily lysophospholipase